MRDYTFYWRTGNREVLKGNDAADALNRAGYGGGAVHALDFHVSGDDKEWQWVEATREWEPAPDSSFARELAASKARMAQ